MTETRYIKTFVARAEGRRLVVRWPGPTTMSTDLPSEDRAKEAAKHIREHGVDCCREAMDRLLSNF